MDILYNAQIVSKESIISGYLELENGKIRRIIKGSPTDDQISQAQSSTDCQEGYLLPGFIDTHVHFRDMEQEHKETLETGSHAALCGGVTTVLTMPNTQPPLSTAATIQKYQNLAQSQKLYCNIGLYAGLKTGFSIVTASA